jgi:hypothetical protein
LEALFRVEALDDLRELLGSDAEDDPELSGLYYPDTDTLAAIVARFGVAFDPGQRQTRLYNLAIRGNLPYLFHSGYELPLLLDGTKKFGFVDHTYPPSRHDDEDSFDHYVAAGILHKEEEIRPFDRPVVRKDGTRLNGARCVYYTQKGEEWRINASRLLWSSNQPWDATLERLWSMVFGYEEWQTDYWIRHNRERSGAWSGIPIYCSVSKNQLDAIEATAFRAFPSVDTSPLFFRMSQERPTYDEALKLMAPGSLALVRANVWGGFLVNVKKGQTGPVYEIQSTQLPELNQNIVGLPELVVRLPKPVDLVAIAPAEAASSA